MSDFFENNKDFYSDVKRNDFNDCIQYADIAMQYLNKPKNPFWTLDKIKKLKWSTRKISNKSPNNIKSLMYYVDGCYIPDAVGKSPAICYFESKDSIVLYPLLEKTQPNRIDYIFSFKNKKFVYYRAYKESINNKTFRFEQSNLAVSHHLDLFFNNELYTNFFSKLLNFTVDKTCSLIYLPNHSKIIQDFGNRILRKSYENNVISYKNYIKLKKASNLILQQPINYERMYFFFIFNHLKYKLFLGLLSKCYTDEELKIYVENFEKNNLYLNSYIIGSKTKSFHSLILNTYDLDVFLRKFFKRKYSRKDKKIVIKLLERKQMTFLNFLYSFRNYYKQEWFCKIYPNTSNLMDLRGSSLTKLRLFSKDYIKTETQKKDFFENITLKKRFWLLNDTCSMYMTFPSNIIKQGLKLQEVHEHLIRLYQNRANITVSKHEQISDNFFYKYQDGYFKDIYNVVKDLKIEGCSVEVPEIAKEFFDAALHLNNCLALYAYKVKNENSFVFFIKENKNLKYAVEVDRDFKIKQYYGKNNKMPEYEDFTKLQNVWKNKVPSNLNNIQRQEELI